MIAVSLATFEESFPRTPAVLAVGITLIRVEVIGLEVAVVVETLTVDEREALD